MALSVSRVVQYIQKEPSTLERELYILEGQEFNSVLRKK